VIRAKAKNRKLLTVDGESITLGKQLDKGRISVLSVFERWFRGS
jgi:hypothetical protein